MRLCHEGSDYAGFIDNDAHVEYEEILLDAYERTSPLNSSYRPTENSSVEEDLENIAEYSDNDAHVERHHPLPVSLGGTKKHGFVTIKLTFQEHFRVHQLLPEFTVGEDRRKMQHALAAMLMNGQILTSEQYAIARQANIDAGVSDETRKKISAAGRARPRLTAEQCEAISIRMRGRTFTTETKAKISNARRGQTTWNKGLVGAQTHTPETRKKQSAAQSARTRGPLSPAHRATLSRAFLGKPLSSEHCAALRAAAVNRKPLPPVSAETRKKISAAIKAAKNIKTSCPHCHRYFERSNYARWHGDRCRQRALAA
jgi:NUMOD3 motif